FELNRAKEKRAAGLRQRELGDRAGASARFTEARDIALEAKEVFSLKLELRLDFGTTTP
ncbi:MAG: hypothetical protein HYT43_01670, partial [Candidatus Taylorbacteria bacterium]|nr:hypothetical protein [Candidatus Taylorbacteria bacterium]